MNVEIDGQTILTRRKFHQQMKVKLDLGDYYGKNLSALRDFLRSEVERPLHLVWTDSQISQEHLGKDYFERIIRIFQDIQDEDEMLNWENRFTYELL